MFAVFSVSSARAETATVRDAINRNAVFMKPPNARLSYIPCQRECVDDVARSDRDELPSVHGVADRGGVHVRARLKMPEMRAGLRVERDEISVFHGGEDDAARGREHAVGQRALSDLEVPD